MDKLKIATPSGLIVRCPHCKDDNEITVAELHKGSCVCPHCIETFAPCKTEDFIKYIESDDKEKGVDKLTCGLYAYHYSERYIEGDDSGYAAKLKACLAALKEQLNKD